MNNFIIFLIILLFTGISILYAGQGMREEDRIFENVLSQAAQIIEKKYNLRYIGGGGSAFNQITFFAITLEGNNAYSKEQLRRILIQSSKIFLQIINTHKKVQQYLSKRPFTIEGIGITIFNNDKNGRDLVDPLISTGNISEGILTYRTRNNTPPLFLYKDTYEESYEEALEILKNENLSPE